MSPTRAFLLLAFAALLSAGCIEPPTPTAEGCQSLCRDNGKSVKLYRVGSAVPLFHPRPSVICECE